MSLSKRKAFTLTELLVVIAIIGILAATITVSLSNARRKGRITRIQFDVQQLKLQLESDADPPASDYSAITGPNTIEEYTTSDTGPVSATGVYANLIAEAEENGASEWVIRLAPRIFKISVKQPDEQYYCVDSMGAANEYGSHSDNTTCP